MGAFVAAWLVGEGIIIYRSVKKQHIPPGPGQLLLSSGVFVLLGLLAESPKARPLAVTLAWGFDIAAFFNLFKVGVVQDGTPGTWPPPQMPDNWILPGGGSGGSGGNSGNGGRQQGGPPPPGPGSAYGGK